MNQLFLWTAFNLFVIVMLVLDLYVFHRKEHTVKMGEAVFWSIFWTVLALLFNVWIYFWRGGETALLFFTGYLLERSLSFDNLFVFLIIFSYFAVDGAHQHRVLFWGILGALIMRAFFIFAGVALIHRFEWIIYVFGAFLIYTGIKLVTEKDKQIHPEKNPILKLFRRFMPVTPGYEGGKFFVKKENRWFATPLFIVLLVVESTDVIFAVDSIPAVLAITTDPFIVYTSNVFAILGLRALYFVLAGMMSMFRFFSYGLAVILVFVGAKMLLAHIIEIPIAFALSIITIILGVSIAASLLYPKKAVSEGSGA